MRRLNLILLAIAVGFFVWILNEVGWANVGHYLRQVGWYWPLLLLPYGLVNLLEAVSWKYLIVNLPRTISLPRLFWLRLGGEALNQLTPTASLGGELFKADRLADRRGPYGPGHRLGGDPQRHPGLEPGSLYLFWVWPWPPATCPRPWRIWGS